MTHLEVPGASLYHEIVGEGPMLLCISGADGSCEIWRGFAEYMKSHFKVVMWDRWSTKQVKSGLFTLLTIYQDVDSHEATSKALRTIPKDWRLTPTMQLVSSNIYLQTSQQRSLETALAP